MGMAGVACPHPFLEDFHTFDSFFSISHTTFCRTLFGQTTFCASATPLVISALFEWSVTVADGKSVALNACMALSRRTIMVSVSFPLESAGPAHFAASKSTLFGWHSLNTSLHTRHEVESMIWGMTSNLYITQPITNMAYSYIDKLLTTFS